MTRWRPRGGADLDVAEVLAVVVTGREGKARRAAPALHVAWRRQHPYVPGYGAPGAVPPRIPARRPTYAKTRRARSKT